MAELSMGLAVSSAPVGRAMLAFTVATGAALVVAAAFSSGKVFALAAMAGVVGMAALWACGNLRLACLWGVGLTAPLGIAKRFHPMPHMGGAGAYSVEAVDIFLLALFLFHLRDRMHGGPRLRLSPVTAWWGGMMLLGLLSAVMTSGQLALLEVAQMAKTLALFLLLVAELVRVRRFLHLFGALCCGLMFQSIIGILQYVKKGDIGLQFLGEATMTTLEYANKATYMDGSDGTFRIGALLGHPNLFAGFIAMSAPMLFAMLMTRLPMRWKLPVAGVLATALLALLLTLSRSGWLAFALTIPIVIGFLLRDRRSRRRALMVVGGSALPAVAAAVAVAPSIIRRFTQSDPGAVDFRWEWMGVAWQMVRDHPLLGVGLNSFIYNLPGRTQYGGTDGLDAHFGKVWPVVHDIYLLTWAEQGTLGFACFIGLLATVLWTGWRNARSCADPLLHALNVGALAGLCANMMDGLGSFFLRQMPGGRLFWIVAAIIVATRYWQERNASHPARVAA